MFETVIESVLPAATEALSASIWVLLGALGAAAGLWWIERRVQAHRWAARLVVVAILILGLTQAWQRLWLCDDAFISFRYAANFAAGEGLVFNPGEWVEGYTNFLWTALLGGLGALGVDIPLAGLFGNLLAFVAAVLLTVACARRYGPERAQWVPWAAIGLCASAGFTTWASSGLETMPATALVLAGIWLTARRPGWGGLLFVLAAMTRPDHLLLWGCMGLALAGEDVIMGDGGLLRRLRWRRYLAFSLPLFLVFVPFFLWRWSAYGDLFPNTYYAKSGGAAYYSQGWVYLSVWLVRSGGWLFVPLMALAALGRPLHRDALRLRLFAVLAVVIFGHYVVRVGGDFMADRFLVVLWPIVLLTLEVRARWLAQQAGRRIWAGALLAAGVAAAVTPVAFIEAKEKRWHIAAEHTFYPVESVAPLVIDSRYFRMGKALEEAFVGAAHRPRLAIGCVGMVGYYSKLPLVDRFGLTNRRIAHKPIIERGRPGHEKKATRDEVLAEEAEIALAPLWGKRWKAATRFKANGVTLHLMQASAGLREVFDTQPLVSTPAALRDRPIDRSQSRTALLVERRFLQRAAPESLRLTRINAALGSLADFEDGRLPLQRAGAEPRLRDGAGRPRGVTGKAWLEVRPRTTVRFAFDLTAHRELRFDLGGVGRAELWVGDAQIRTAAPARRNMLRPVSWQVDTVQMAELRLEAGSAPLWIDAIRVPAAGDVRQRLAQPLGSEPVVDLLHEAERTLPADDPQVVGFKARHVVRHLNFEDRRWPAGVTVEGRAFGRGPARGAVGRQLAVLGVGGQRLVNSFHGRDSATGTLTLAIPALPSRIELRVGGGRDCKTVYVALRIAGKIVRRACGQNDEQLRAVVWPTRTWAGQPGELVIVDARRGRWGHILVDDVMLIEPSAAVVQPVR